ncbi:MAG TPA: hypothetical protein VM580_18440, partial [Labilithrix sp.]|nr:hypothetical protein [Labilithrix sp.]
MGRTPPPRFDIEALHVRLCERITELDRLIVADVMRVFLEVSSLPCEQMLWSVEFAFDEDDGRVARLEARFVKRGAQNPLDDELAGYDVHLLLPNVIPSRPPADGIRAATLASEIAAADGSLVARFLRALTELGAYRT